MTVSPAGPVWSSARWMSSGWRKKEMNGRLSDGNGR